MLVTATPSPRAYPLINKKQRASNGGLIGGGAKGANS
jgi:hypothetical protein